jgi:hypothetical protein
VNRAELQQLAEDRILDAQALLAAARWSGAYYLAGYAVECGLKSCVLAYIIRTGAIFQEGNKRYSERCYTHNLEELVKLAELEVARGLDVSANPLLGNSWLTVSYWTETSRYQTKTQTEAEHLFGAITDPTNGVLPWIRKHW